MEEVEVTRKNRKKQYQHFMNKQKHLDLNLTT
jgi:hypothetical protein